MRSKNSFFNFLANTGSHIINVILSFIVRTIFVYVLSQEYLGVNGLFGNILTVLSLAELGIGGAMTFHLYKPIAEGNEESIRQLMNLYKRLYTIVAIVVAAMGLALVPFLDIFVNGETSMGMQTLTIIYLLYLANTVCSYLWGYKRAIIDGHQKAYIGTIYNTVFTMTQFVLQIIVLLAFKNFLLYLIIQIACSIATNIVVARKADKMFPYLKEDKKSLPSKEEKKKIGKSVGAMSLHKLGDVVVNNTDNLIMSAFVGLISTGIYSNYQMIQATVNTALNGVFGAFTASIGNLGAMEDKDRIYEVYKSLLFLGFWLYGFSTAAFIILYNPFIATWTSGAEGIFIFSMPVVLLIVANYYVAGMRKVTLIFRDALGLYWYDRYKPIAEVIINLVFSLLLVVKIGIEGIFIGTLISTMTTCFWIEPLVTYKYGFKKKVRSYFAYFALYTAIVTVVTAFNYWLCDYVCSALGVSGWLDVAVRAVVLTVVYNAIILLMFFKTKEFRFIWGKAMGLLKGYINRKKNIDGE